MKQAWSPYSRNSVVQSKINLLALVYGKLLTLASSDELKTCKKKAIELSKMRIFISCKS